MSVSSVWSMNVKGSLFHSHMRAVRKVSGHFEYLKNWSCALDVTWQPVRRDLTVHLWTVTVQWG